MKKSAWLLASACLLLAACFKSEKLLFDLGAAAHPLPDGTWSGGPGDDRDSFTLTAKGASYLKVDGDSHDDVVMVPLPGHADTYAAAEANEGCLAEAGPNCDWDYAIVVMRGDAAHEIPANCSTDWAMVQADAARRSEDGDTCYFDDPAKLLHALSAVADHGGEGVEFQRQ